MFPNMDEKTIQETMRGMLSALPGRELPEARTTVFIARLYKVSEERRRIIDLMPFARTRAFAAVAAMLICVIGYNYLLLPLSPVVVNATGTVKIYSARKNEWSFVGKRRVKLAKNDVVKTFDDGQADVMIPGIYQMRLKRKSEVRLARSISRLSSGNITYDVARGKVFTYYDKTRKTGREFELQTSEALVSAVGTDFMVEAAPASTWIGVLDGMVRVTGVSAQRLAGEAKAVLVEPGQKTVVRPGLAPEKPGRLMESELMDLEELYRIGTKPQVAILISSGRTRTRELLAATPLYVSSKKEGVLPAEMDKIIRTFNQAIKTRSKERYAENIRQFERLLERYPDPKYNVQFSLFIAAYYEHLGEHDKAIAAFRKVIEKYPQSSFASVAQCAIGIIYEEKLNDTAQAKFAYEKIISAYPDSPEVEEARHGLERLSR